MIGPNMIKIIKQKKILQGIKSLGDFLFWKKLTGGKKWTNDVPKNVIKHIIFKAERVE